MPIFFDGVDKLCVTAEISLREIMEVIDRHASGIALVVDTHMRLMATITDGDIRRAVLMRVNLEQRVADVLAQDPLRAPPITAAVDQSRGALLALMADHQVQQVPILDSDGCVVDLALLKNLQRESGPPMQALIMAGGLGTRLMPLTQNTPKPMLLVGGRPLLERTIERLTAAGVRQVNISTHYLPEKIMSHFGDGSKFGVTMRYVREERPLGTGGALALLGDITQTTLVINGDIVTDLDFLAMAQFHHEHRAAATMAVAKYDIAIPYGVVQHNGVDVTGLLEKPVISQFINAGIYLVEPRVQPFLKRDCIFNMTDLMERLIANGERVVVFPVREYWIDVGRPADYERVQQDVGTGRIKGAHEPVL